MYDVTSSSDSSPVRVCRPIMHCKSPRPCGAIKLSEKLDGVIRLYNFILSTREGKCIISEIKTDKNTLYLGKIKLSTLYYRFITNVDFLSYSTDLPHFPAVSHLNEEQLCHSKILQLKRKNLIIEFLTTGPCLAAKQLLVFALAHWKRPPPPKKNPTTTTKTTVNFL